MKAMLWPLVSAAAMFVVAMTGVAAPAQAQNYPWCAYYGAGEDGGGTNCGFVSFEQCMATLSGMGGFCNRNTQYQPPAGPSDQHHARHRSRDRRS
jgi:Protein of unknown function (DUF3551)